MNVYECVIDASPTDETEAKVDSDTMSLTAEMIAQCIDAPPIGRRGKTPDPEVAKRREIIGLNMNNSTEELQDLIEAADLLRPSVDVVRQDKRRIRKGMKAYGS